ncbi:MAG: hypothetical protein J0M17_10485 [Planctomycetes bacterium]|nr:hypothetical protein [Planctomycetota bacterium]
MALVGCRNRPTQLDPFLGRTTVPPPPTGSVGVGGTSVPALTAPPSGSVYAPPGGFGSSSTAATGSSPTGTVAPPPSFTNNSTPSTPARFTGTGSAAMPSSGVTGSSGQSIRVVEPSPSTRPATTGGNLYTGASAGGVDIMDLPVSGRSAQPKTAEGTRGVQQNYTSGGTAGGLDMSAARSVTLPGQEPAYGFDTAYSQLNGRLEYSAADGRWLLRYITPGDRTDRLGGVAVLSPNSPITGFRSGDMVSVRGRIENDGAGRTMPLYSAATINAQRSMQR